MSAIIATLIIGVLIGQWTAMPTINRLRRYLEQTHRLAAMFIRDLPPSDEDFLHEVEQEIRK